MVFGLESYIGNPYLRALVVVVVVFIVLRIFVSIIQRVFLKITEKTKTKADDLLVQKSSRPLSMLIVFIGLRLAIGELGLDEAIESVVGNIIASFIIIYVAYVAYLILDIALFGALKKVTKSHYDAVKDLISLLKSVLKLVLAVLAFLYILSLWGIEIGPFLAGLGIAGIAIAFALQSTLSNVFSGVSMILDKSVKAGDLVYLDATARGEVMHIGLRSTKIRTFDNELIIVPNAKLADSNIQNVALPEPKTRVVIPFGVAYGSDIDKVKKIVMDELKKIKNLAKDPAFRIRFLEMADSSLNFKAYFYVDDFEHRANAIDEANTRIYNALNKAKIEIPFPQMDIHMKKK